MSTSLTTSGLQIKEARKKKRWSQQELAQRVGIHQQTLNKIERGRIKFSRHLLPIQRELGIVEEGMVGANGAGFLVGDAAQIADDWKEIKVFYSQFCAEPVEHNAMVLPAATKKIARASLLQDAFFERDAYAVVVGVPVMSPAYEVGDVIYVNPTLPAEPNKDVLLRKELGGDSEGAMVIIAQLVQDTPAGWRVLQHNGLKKREFTVAKNQYPKCHRIISKINR